MPVSKWIIVGILFHATIFLLPAQQGWVHRSPIVHINTVSGGGVYFTDLQSRTYFISQNVFEPLNVPAGKFSQMPLSLGDRLLVHAGNTFYTFLDGEVIDSIQWSGQTRYLAFGPDSVLVFNHGGVEILDDRLAQHQPECKGNLVRPRDIAGAVALRKAMVLLEDSCFSYYCTPSRDRICLDAKISAASSFDRGMMMAMDTGGLMYYDGARLRRFFVPGVIFPDDVTEMALSDNELWMHDADGVLYAYITDRQIIHRIATNVNAFAMDEWNVLWYAIDNRIYRDNRYANDSPPQLRIDAPAGGDQGHHATGSVTLNEGRQSVMISATGRYPPDPEGLFYRYRIDDGAWKSTKRPEVILNDLGNGTHRFEMSAMTRDGLTSAAVNLDIKVVPPLWSSPWFVLFVVLVLLIVAGLLSQWRLGALKDQMKRERRMHDFQIDLLQEQQKVGQLQLNPHFIFNSLTAIKGLIATGDKQSARKGLNEFAAMMRFILERAGHDVIPVKEEVAFLKRYLEMEKLCRQDSFDFRVINNVHPDLLIPPMTIQPFLENAIVHGIAPLASRGKVIVTFKEERNFIEVRIEDNGVGRRQAEQNKRAGHHSMSTRIIEQRLAVHGKWIDKELVTYRDLADGSGKAAGTEVILRIAYRHDK